MKKWLGYCIFENEGDFKRNVKDESTPYYKDYRLDGAMTWVPDEYPYCCKYEPDWDPRCCGYWLKVSPEEVLKTWEESVKNDMQFFNCAKKIFNHT